MLEKRLCCKTLVSDIQLHRARQLTLPPDLADWRLSASKRRTREADISSRCNPVELFKTVACPEYPESIELFSATLQNSGSTVAYETRPMKK